MEWDSKAVDRCCHSNSKLILCPSIECRVCPIQKCMAVRAFLELLIISCVLLLYKTLNPDKLSALWNCNESKVKNEHDIIVIWRHFKIYCW